MYELLKTIMIEDLKLDPAESVSGRELRRRRP